MASSALATYPGTNGRIAFQLLGQCDCGGGFIYTVRRNGSDLRRLTGDRDYDPAWSANGRRISFDRDMNGQREIYTMRADGTGQRRITYSSKLDERDPYYSPGGGRVVFAEGSSAVGQSWSAIAVMHSDGSQRTALTRRDYDNRTGDPEFSPDGQHIVFSSSGIWTLRSDGSHKRRLTRRNDLSPDYSPDGRRIVFTRWAKDGATTKTMLMGSDGSNVHELFGLQNATYSPGGRLLAGTVLNEYGGDIWTSWLDGSHSTQVTDYQYNQGYFATDPAWQPVPVN